MAGTNNGNNGAASGMSAVASRVSSTTTSNMNAPAREAEVAIVARMRSVHGGTVVSDAGDSSSGSEEDSSDLSAERSSSYVIDPHGDDSNATNGVYEAHVGWTALHVAAECGAMGVARALLAAGRR